MKVCSSCKSENEDQYIYCVGCHKPLPKQTHLENLMTLGLSAMDKKDYRKAITHFDDILKLNVGNKDAWFLKGMCLIKMGIGKEGRSCLRSAGVKISEHNCYHCMSSKKCRSCDQTGRCFMCRGKRTCGTCGGSGKCQKCGGSGKESVIPKGVGPAADPELSGKDCSICSGLGKCPRCRGTGHCSYCKGTNVCPDCNGTKICIYCGGTGRELMIDENSVPKNLRKYI
jgi:hypothetical protein